MEQDVALTLLVQFIAIIVLRFCGIRLPTHL